MNVPIENNHQVEMTRTLAIQLEKTDSLDSRILIVNSSGNLTIYDDPSDGIIILSGPIHNLIDVHVVAYFYRCNSVS